MAKTRNIDTKFWDDNYISNLDPVEKLLFLYFLTNSLTNVSGIYEIPLKRIGFDTGIDKEMVQKIINRFTKEEKIFYIDGWIVIKNFSKHQSYNPNMKIGANKAFEAVPDNIWLKIQEIETLAKAFETLTECFPILELKLELELKSKLELEPDIATIVAGEIIPDLLNDKQKHIQIIGLYARAKNVNFSALEEQRSFIRRNVKPAMNLAPYDPHKIICTMKYLIDNADFKWTLESVGKYIDEDLNKLSFNKTKTIVV
jgi:hypothetical protein